jgi:hypothetical protein
MELHFHSPSTSSWPTLINVCFSMHVFRALGFSPVLTHILSGEVNFSGMSQIKCGSYCRNFHIPLILFKYGSGYVGGGVLL